jgi:hypothetical protein
MQTVRRNSGKIQHCGVWLLLSTGRQGDVSEHIKVGASPLAHRNCGAAAAATTWIARLPVVIATISLTPIVGKSLLCESGKSIERNYCGWISIILGIIIHSWSVSLLVCLFLCSTASVFLPLFYCSFISLFLYLSLSVSVSRLCNFNLWYHVVHYVIQNVSREGSYCWHLKNLTLLFFTWKLMLFTVTWSVAGAVLFLIVTGMIK